MFYFNAQAGITEVYFLLFNLSDKRTLSYLDSANEMNRVNKGAL